MNPSSDLKEPHDQRLLRARRDFFHEGIAPHDLVDHTILRSWERCRDSGLAPRAPGEGEGPASLSVLKNECDRNRAMILHAEPVMEHVYEQIRHSGSMVVLADAQGMLLRCVGDAEFVDRASRVALQPGAWWDEQQRGTNAVGTALAEERAVEVFGAEHFFERNVFLTCSASPLLDPQGRLIGVLDISSDYRAYQRHTLGLVRMSARLIENRLFESEHARDLIVAFHPRAEYLGSLGEGMLAVARDGRILAVNGSGLELLGLRRNEVINRDFSALFALQGGSLMDRILRDTHAPYAANTQQGRQLFLKVRGNAPSLFPAGRAVVEGIATPKPTRSRTAETACSNQSLSLEQLATGDERLQQAIDKARRILGRDIPMLIQGESGAGKEMFAKAFHNSGPRAAAPFIALNCAAIPETLIESELFGYQGGAFTGARKEGAVGKIQQAHGGTLFLDEIGDMPLALQARLLRVLQERMVTPLGSGKAVAVDISLVCATHRRLKDEVAQGNFREDLYYRLHGLSITLPALRERSDLTRLVHKLIHAEVGDSRPVTVSAATMERFAAYGWPGNLRQLNNVIRVAIALLDDDETVIEPQHLPEELFESLTPLPEAAAAVVTPGLLPGTRLEELEQQAILGTLEAMHGNISAAARKLGISRNTLYRKLGRL